MGIFPCGFEIIKVGWRHEDEENVNRTMKHGKLTWIKRE